MDLTGKVIDVIVPTAQVEKLDLAKYQNGVYFYQIVNNGEIVKTDKFVVTK